MAICDDLVCSKIKKQHVTFLTKVHPFTQGFAVPHQSSKSVPKSRFGCQLLPGRSYFMAYGSREVGGGSEPPPYDSSIDGAQEKPPTPVSFRPRRSRVEESSQHRWCGKSLPSPVSFRDQFANWSWESVPLHGKAMRRLQRQEITDCRVATLLAMTGALGFCVWNSVGMRREQAPALR